MIPAVSYGDFISFDNFEEHNCCQLRPFITTKSDSGLADHYTLFVNLNLSVKSCARRHLKG